MDLKGLLRHALLSLRARLDCLTKLSCTGGVCVCERHFLVVLRGIPPHSPSCWRMVSDIFSELQHLPVGFFSKLWRIQFFFLKNDSLGILNIEYIGEQSSKYRRDRFFLNTTPPSYHLSLSPISSQYNYRYRVSYIFPSPQYRRFMNPNLNIHVWFTFATQTICKT